MKQSKGVNGDLKPEHKKTKTGPRLVRPQFSEPEFVPKDVTIKMNLLLYRILNEQIEMQESLVLFLFPHRTRFGYL